MRRKKKKAELSQIGNANPYELVKKILAVLESPAWPYKDLKGDCCFGSGQLPKISLTYHLYPPAICNPKYESKVSILSAQDRERADLIIRDILYSFGASIYGVSYSEDRTVRAVIQPGNWKATLPKQGFGVLRTKKSSFQLAHMEEGELEADD
jgi:hypothetical protein